MDVLKRLWALARDRKSEIAAVLMGGVTVAAQLAAPGSTLATVLTGLATILGGVAGSKLGVQAHLAEPVADAARPPGLMHPHAGVLKPPETP